MVRVKRGTRNTAGQGRNALAGLTEAAQRVGICRDCIFQSCASLTSESSITTMKAVRYAPAFLINKLVLLVMIRAPRRTSTGNLNTRNKIKGFSIRYVRGRLYGLLGRRRATLGSTVAAVPTRLRVAWHRPSTIRTKGCILEGCWSLARPGPAALEGVACVGRFAANSKLITRSRGAKS